MASTTNRGHPSDHVELAQSSSECSTSSVANMFSAMTTKLVIFIILCHLCQKSLEQKSETRSDMLRICIVEGKGLYKKAGRYCPMLETSNIGLQCVIGLDRLDCLRRISKGTVDFGVFSSEDLLAATWADIDVLVTDELRFHDEPFEYEVVAIVDNSIESLEDLRGSRLCHPGYGYEADWTDTLANFFESKIITRKCDPSLSLMENKLQQTTEFFSAACKAGPWVSDKLRDRTLKTIYPNLCSLCYDPLQCSSSDKYWGRRGPLHCLTEESGNVAWARLDDTRVHFSLSGKIGIADPENYSYMCPDGTKKPLRNTTHPCVWIAKPWPVIAAKRKSAAAVSALTSQLSHEKSNSWQSALLNLIEFYHINPHPLRPQIPVQDYLQRAVGFQSANSFAECSPPRSITVCTTNLMARHKCDWLSEISRANGLEPQLQCETPTKINNITDIYKESVCMEELKNGRAEVMMAHPNWQIIAKRKYSLEPIIYESSLKMNDLYIVNAIVKKNSSINTMADLKGKRACFPMYEGVSWYSISRYLKNQKLTEPSECSQAGSNILEYFSGVCAFGPTSNEELTKMCKSQNQYYGEIGALKCLVDGLGDVAFISRRTLNNVREIKGNENLPHDFDPRNYMAICPPDNKNDCYISWSSIGHVYTLANSNKMRRQEIINTFKQLDQLFGKTFKSPTSAFTMYGPFDHEHNILFQDRTYNLKTIDELSNTRLMYNHELVSIEHRGSVCYVNSFGLPRWTVSKLLLVLPIIVFIFHM